MTQWTQLVQLVLHFDHQLGGAIAQYGAAVYAILFAIIFLEIAFIPLFFLPGDPLLFICGAFCASGSLDLRILVPVLVAATVAGSAVNYRIGRVVGQQVYTRDYRWLDRGALEKTHRFYEARGGLTFLLSPFLAVIRTFAPFVAGVSGMTFARFLSFVLAGAVLWVISLTLAGYFFGNVPLIRDHLSAIVPLGIGIGVGALLVLSGVRAFKARGRRV